VHQGIRAGSKRWVGFRNGDCVTIVATKDPQGRLIPEMIFGGDRQGLLDWHGEQVAKGSTLGSVSVGIALFLLVFAALRSRLRRSARSPRRNGPV